MEVKKKCEKQAVRWVFTWNNYGELRPVFDADTMHFMVYQGEVGTVGGTHHIQGYVRFKKIKRMSQVKRMLGSDTIHLESARGSEKECATYCTKLETREWGPDIFGVQDDTVQGQGHRSDLASAAAILTEGGTVRDAGIAHPEVYIRYRQGLESYARLLVPPVNWIRPMRTIILWGNTSVGKSYRVNSAFHNGEMFRVTSRPGGEFDNYIGQKVVFFEEFHHERFSIDLMKQLCDVYPFDLPARYTNAPAAYNLVVISSQLDPRYWWMDRTVADRDAFLRRCVIYEIIDNQNPVVDFTIPQ